LVDNLSRCAEGIDEVTQGAAHPALPVLEFARWDQAQAPGETILLVEDEAFVRQVAEEILCSAGYRVLRARSAEEAFVAFRKYNGQVDMLLADIVLPGEDGRSLARRLRVENPPLKVLFITGYAKQIVTGGAADEREECLAKPFSGQALLQRIRHVLNEGRKSRAS
jgi:CheY-like chemotaxis protein